MKLTAGLRRAVARGWDAFAHDHGRCQSPTHRGLAPVATHVLVYDVPELPELRHPVELCAACGKAWKTSRLLLSLTPIDRFDGCPEEL